LISIYRVPPFQTESNKQKEKCGDMLSTKLQEIPKGLYDNSCPRHCILFCYDLLKKHLQRLSSGPEDRHIYLIQKGDCGHRENTFGVSLVCLR